MLAITYLEEGVPTAMTGELQAQETLDAVRQLHWHQMAVFVEAEAPREQLACGSAERSGLRLAELGILGTDAERVPREPWRLRRGGARAKHLLKGGLVERDRVEGAHAELKRDHLSMLSTYVAIATKNGTISSLIDNQ